MDHLGYKLTASAQRRPAECSTSEAEHEGSRYSLCLIRHHYRGEGDAILERITAEDKPNGEPVGTEFHALGRWYVRDSEDVSRLRVEFDSVDDLGDAEAIINKLLMGLSDGVMGVDVVEAYP
jgi:hypothetical protein